MVELEALNEYRFYKLEPYFPNLCTNIVENIYAKVDKTVSTTRICGGHLWLHMKVMSVNSICKVCKAEYEIPRVCTSCNKEHLFEDITCDNCEQVVINITTLYVSIAEANKAIKKVNRAFKQNLIEEKEWRMVLVINQDEVERCQKLLEKEEI